MSNAKKAKKKKHPLPLLLKACPLWGILYMLSATWSVQGSSDFPTFQATAEKGRTAPEVEAAQALL